MRNANGHVEQWRIATETPSLRSLRVETLACLKCLSNSNGEMKKKFFANRCKNTSIFSYTASDIICHTLERVSERAREREREGISGRGIKQQAINWFFFLVRTNFVTNTYPMSKIYKSYMVLCSSGL